MDHISKEHRSWNMSRIGSKNTKPEKYIRSILHLQGYRFRLHGKVSKKHYAKGVLPGKPDIVLVKHKIVIFVNGCFWHQHENCKRANIPKSNTEYWINKLEKNVKRDEKNINELEKIGWKYIVIWECEIKNENFVEELKSRLNEKINSR